MRLVGATDGFIRRPFLLEGALQSSLGGLLALLLLFAFHRAFFPRLGANLALIGGDALAFLPPLVALGCLAGAALVGLSASFLAVSRFLDE